MTELAVHEDSHGVVFAAKIVPGSSRTAVAGVLDDMVKIRVAAPPEKGKANQCLVAFLAKLLGVRKSDVEVVSGQSRPVKQVQVTGISAAQLLEKLGLAERNKS
jgi:uncharacterized protein (TIGR00251 family)